MAHQHPTGIIRTESGRDTYLPDGMGVDGAYATSSGEKVETPYSTDESSATEFAPVRPGQKGILDGANYDGDEKGRKESEDSYDLHQVQSRAAIDPEEVEELNRIATQLTRHQTMDSHFFNSQDPTLQPESKEFDIRKWVKNLIHSMNESGIKTKRAGFVFKDLSVSGSGDAVQLQQTVASTLLSPLRVGEFLHFGRKQHKQILRNFNGVLKSGEMLIVLGRPGSGCSTFLKSVSGELHGLTLGKDSDIHYNGISQEQMMKEYRGEVVYNQEVDKHFPHLTVGETLEFAAAARTPHARPGEMSRKEHIKLLTKVIMAVFGLSHTYNTKVGDDFVRGVSGGERKRVSIAEMALAGSPISNWDNSTRGLDAATALKFVRSLRMTADLFGSTSSVAIYQASQAIYDEFDKAIVLYEGRQIYYGAADKAKAFFEKQGWYCEPRQTTGDFLTSVTNPAERKAKDGMNEKVPRTPEEFEKYWQQSPEYKANLQEVEEHENDYPKGGQTVHDFQELKTSEQAQHQRHKSPYLISVPMQVRLCVKRAYQRTWNDKSSTLATVFIQIIMALIIGSVFYNTPDATVGFFAKGATLFFAILFNALLAVNEINALYSQRPIVEKHKSYAFYHPATEAIAGIAADIPVKFVLAVAFNIILYFMTNLRREPSQFFIYFLVVYTTMFVMSAVFRTLAAVTKTISQAMALAGVMILALVIYTGFVLPVPQMHPWFSWIRFINPIFYAFEILIANEFHGRLFTCSAIVPAYTPLQGDYWICGTSGAVAGQTFVSGDAFIQNMYEYTYAHVWRNYGILIAFLVGFMIIYFIATELNSSTSSTAEVLVFRRGHVPAYIQNSDEPSNDEEMAKETSNAQEGGESDEINAIPPQKDVFTWRDVCYDIKIKGGDRRLLDHVSGWVKPGTLTALMGVSGAGKTTLLDVLAQRTTMGVVTGDMFVNGAPLDDSFQRKTGYVQQQDLHLETATVRESLQFSALLRQPKSVSKQEKFDYVEDVIKMLNMEDFAEAVVGIPGQGLNVEQRKLLTIGVELAAKPKLLLFLDEPTSGLDSQSSWAIVAFLRKLADAGQAVLCTIHQPSAILFQEFDRLLFLAKGGKTVYFGPVGKNSRDLLDYFEANGAPKCGDEENPAEYMLEIVNKGQNDNGEDWFDVWKASDESKEVQKEIDNIHEKKKGEKTAGEEEEGAHDEFAMPFGAQLSVVTHRVFQQYWRMPSYVLAKWFLGISAGLFIGFSFFRPDSSQQGAQSIIFSGFMISTIFSTLVQQIMPLFVTQRSLYEVRERPSKAYSWKAFLIANIVVEIPYQIMLGILVFACYYYPIVGIQASVRQGLVLLFLVQFFIYASTFAHMCIAALPDAQTAASIVTLLFAMSLIFNGVMQSPTALPGFWIFMYRVSPFTYWIAGIAATEGAGRQINCSATETSVFNPPPGQTCGEYLAPYLSQAPGTLQNPGATANCQYCQLSNTDQFLAASNIYYSERWRNFGLVWAYVLFNIFVAVITYYLVRVRKSKGDSTGIKSFFKRNKNKAGHGEKIQGNEDAPEQANEQPQPF